MIWQGNDSAIALSSGLLVQSVRVAEVVAVESLTCELIRYTFLKAKVVG